MTDLELYLWFDWSPFWLHYMGLCSLDEAIMMDIADSKYRDCFPHSSRSVCFAYDS